MREISVREVNQNFSQVIAAAERGETIVVTKNGRPVAKITPQSLGEFLRFVHVASRPPLRMRSGRRCSTSPCSACAGMTPFRAVRRIRSADRIPFAEFGLDFGVDEDVAVDRDADHGPSSPYLSSSVMVPTWRPDPRFDRRLSSSAAKLARNSGSLARSCHHAADDRRHHQHGVRTGARIACSSGIAASAEAGAKALLTENARPRLLCCRGDRRSVGRVT